MRTSSQRFNESVESWIENGKQELWSVYLPAGFTSDDEIYVEGGNGEEKGRFTRRTDLPVPEGESLWKQEGIADVPPYQAVVRA